MKGIILAGGSGTRLYPLTLISSKQLLPVYDKPMIYYPLSTLMLAGIRDILIISTPNDLNSFKKLLGNGESFGISLTYLEQVSPDGLAHAFIIAEDFIGDSQVAMILGDNIFYGSGLSNLLQEAVEDSSNGIATIFGYYVSDPQRFGIAEFDKDGKVLSIEEKPKNPRSNYCVTGLYFYDHNVVKYAKSLKPSKRGELEITDLNNLYLSKDKINIKLLGRGFAWLDTGTFESLAAASEFVRTIEQRQGIKISAIEEIAYIKGWITTAELLNAAKKYGKSPYGDHLRNVAEGKYMY